MSFILFLLGFYVGAGFVTSIVVRTVDGRETSIGQVLFLAAFWPYILLTAGDE